MAEKVDQSGHWRDGVFVQKSTPKSPKVRVKVSKKKDDFDKLA